MRTTDYDAMRDRHHNGMCGGDCPECYREQREDAYREQERQAAYEQQREEEARLQNPDSSNLVVAPGPEPECTCGYDATPTQHRVFCPWLAWWHANRPAKITDLNSANKREETK